VAYPGSPPRRLSERPDNQHGRSQDRARRPARPERPRWQVDAFGPDDTDADLPPWAGPAVHAPRTGGTRRAAVADPDTGEYSGETTTRVDVGHHAGPADSAADAPGSRTAARRRGRAAATRLRKSRRRVYRLSAVGVAVCVVGAVIAVIATQSSPKPTPYVTSLLPGEFKSVPSACGSVSAAVLGQYLPGHRTTTNQFSAATESQCSFTADAKPVFRLLEVTAQAYQPFAAASGNGSASANAADSLALVKATLTQPAKKSLLSPAQITSLPAVGPRAFAAAQTEKAGGIVSDVVTVVVLERNVLITVVLSAQETPGFSPTPVATLQAGATAAAQDVLTKVKTQPVA
jgi:hypothetical protein